MQWSASSHILLWTHVPVHLLNIVLEIELLSRSWPDKTKTKKKDKRKIVSWKKHSGTPKRQAAASKWQATGTAWAPWGESSCKSYREGLYLCKEGRCHDETNWNVRSHGRGSVGLAKVGGNSIRVQPQSLSPPLVTPNLLTRLSCLLCSALRELSTTPLRRFRTT